MIGLCGERNGLPGAVRARTRIGPNGVSVRSVPFWVAALSKSLVCSCTRGANKADGEAWTPERERLRRGRIGLRTRTLQGPAMRVYVGRCARVCWACAGSRIKREDAHGVEKGGEPGSDVERALRCLTHRGSEVCLTMCADGVGARCLRAGSDVWRGRGPRRTTTTPPAHARARPFRKKLDAVSRRRSA